MKKRSNKLMVLLLAVLMIMCAGIVSFAAGGASITGGDFIITNNLESGILVVGTSNGAPYSHAQKGNGDETTYVTPDAITDIYTYGPAKLDGKYAPYTITKESYRGYTYHIKFSDFAFEGDVKFSLSYGSVDPIITKMPKGLTSDFTGGDRDLVEQGTADCGTFMYSLTGEPGSYDEEVPVASEAGKYSVYYMVQGDYGTNDIYFDDPLEAELLAKEVYIEWADTEADYTGEAQLPKATVNGVVAGDQCYVNGFSVYDGTTEVKGAVDAGTYTVYATALTSSNYVINLSENSTEFKINKVDPTVSEEPTARKFDMTAEDLSLVTPGKVEGGKFLYSLTGEKDSYDEEVPVAEKCGYYKVFWMVEGDENHKDLVPDGFVEVRVLGMDAEIEDWTYGAVPSALKVTLHGYVMGEDTYTATYRPLGDEEAEWKPFPGEDPFNAGYYELSVVYNEKPDKWNAKTIFIVNEADAVLTTEPVAAVGLSYIKNEEQKLLMVDAESADGKVKYAVTRKEDADATELEYSEEAPVAIRIGTYYVYTMVEGDENHNDTYFPDPVVTEIAKEKVYFIPVPVSLDYEKLAESDLTLDDLKDLDLDKLLKLYVKAKGGIRITNADYGDAVYIFPFIIDSTGEFRRVKLKDGIVTVKYTDDDDSDYSGLFIGGITKLDAGYYTLSAKLSKTLKHDAVESNVPLTIYKLTPTVTQAPEAKKGLVANGKEQEVLTPGTAVDGKIVYSKERDGEYTTKIPTFKDAGKYDVFYKAVTTKEGPNYKDTDPVKLEAVIAESAVPIVPDDDTPAVDPTDDDDVIEVTVPAVVNFKATGRKKSVYVTWNKQTTNVDFVEIQYAGNGSFKSAKTIKVDNSKRSYRIKKLKGGKKVFVRMRNVKVVDGERYTSNWTEAKKVVVKK
jgi:hypothetical protein